MAQSVSVAARHPQLAAAVRAAAAGQHKPVYLLAGESFETRAAAQALLDVLVPAERRAFNLETYDGRTTPLAAVIDSLRMPGFFPGIKAVWVRETTLFLSGEKRSDLTHTVLAAWSDGREQEAAEKLLTLAALAGWSQEQFRETRLSTLGKTRLRELCGEEPDPEQAALLDAVQAACVARDLGVGAYRDDSAVLIEFLDAGVGAGGVLVLTASAVDARKRLYKRLKDIGAVVDVSAARERSGALSRETVDDLVQHVVHEFGKRLETNAHQLVVRRAGTDVAMLAMELEKLCLYAGDQPSISEEDVRQVFRDMGESWIFDFTAALASRQLAPALPLLRGLLEQGEPPLRLLAMIARELRLLLVARECLDDSLRGKWRGNLPFNVFQTRLLPLLDADTRQAFGNAHPFVVYKRLQDAARMDTRALCEALVRLSDLDAQLKSSRSDPALLLEAFVIAWCRGAGKERSSSRPLESSHP